MVTEKKYDLHLRLSIVTLKPGKIKHFYPNSHGVRPFSPFGNDHWDHMRRSTFN